VTSGSQATFDPDGGAEPVGGAGVSGRACPRPLSSSWLLGPLLHCGSPEPAPPPPTRLNRPRGPGPAPTHRGEDGLDAVLVRWRPKGAGVMVARGGGKGEKGLAERHDDNLDGALNLAGGSASRAVDTTNYPVGLPSRGGGARSMAARPIAGWARPGALGACVFANCKVS
jgi:hypothetical protein